MEWRFAGQSLIGMRANNSHGMKVLHCFLLVLLGPVLAAPPHQDDLSDDTIYMKELKRTAKAAEMEGFMNQKVDPCQDFYKFACGNFGRINSASALQVLSTGVFEGLSKSMNRKLLKMLDAPSDGSETPEDLQVKHYYESCLRMKELAPVYSKKLRAIIAEFGSMPLLEGSKWNEADFDWLGTTARMAHRYGISPIVGVEMNMDLANNTINRVYLGAQEFPLEARGMYFQNETLIYRIKYQSTMERMLVTFLGVEKKLAMVAAKEFLDFEVDLAHGMLDESDGQNIMNLTELLSPEELHRRYWPTLDVKRLINVTLGEQVTEKVYEFNSLYQRNLVEVMKRTPLRIVANYMFFRLVYEFIETPSNDPQAQKTKCLAQTRKPFAKNLDNMFYRRYKYEKSAQEIESMWSQLKATFAEMLRSSRHLDWIDRSTRNLAIVKLQAMTLRVNNYADVDFSEEFAGLNLQSTDYVENVRQISLLSARQMRAMLHSPPEPLDVAEQLSYTPANILVENGIKVPVALLQPFYIWADVYPIATMFGTLATLIGHELIHGFDDTGRGFDAQGNAHAWWDERSSANFEERRKCFTRQYGKYVYDGIKLKESTSQSENIADNGGLRLAYHAYRNWYEMQLGTSTQGQDLERERLPYLNYTGKQLFFISFAQIWCNDAHPNVKALKVSTDQHMPGEFRVIGSLSNLEEFSEVFHCAAGTPMNPAEKCMLY